MQDKSFIADLIPQHPIYVPLLPSEAQDVIGEVHQNTRPALFLLLQEGFKVMNQIDIFEAGPFVKALVKDVRAVRDSREAVVGDVVKEVKEKEEAFIIMKTQGIKSVVGFLDVCEDGHVVIN